MADTTSRSCGRCGSPLNPFGTLNLCVKCLAASAAREGLELEFPEPEAAAAGGGAGVQSRHFGGFELMEEVARGGMGVIYRARQAGLDRDVALKLLLYGQYSGPDFVQRFKGEAAAAARLRHPNIVAIHDFGEHEGQPYIAMEFVPGRSLAMRLRTGPMLPREAAELAKTLAGAVQHAHDRGVIHRDLKPSNILLDSDGRPRITDFGLAKLMGDVSEITQTGQVLGSPSYMPPEQARGENDRVGPASDVYSLGAVLYHALTGRPPFQSATATQTLRHVSEAVPVMPRQLNGNIPRDLETLCMKALEKEPARRFGTAREFEDELDRFLRGEPIRARPISRWEQAERWCRRHPFESILLLALAAVSAAGFLAVVHQWRRARAGEYEALRALYAADMTLSYDALMRNSVAEAQARLDAFAVGGTDRQNLRGWEWYHLSWLARTRDELRFSDGSNAVFHLHFSGEQDLWTAGFTAGRPVRHWWLGHSGVSLRERAFDDAIDVCWQGDVMAVLRSNGLVSFRSLAGQAGTGNAWRPDVNVPGDARRLAWSADREWLALGGRSNVILQSLIRPGAREVYAAADPVLAFSTRGLQLAVGERNGRVTIREPGRGSPVADHPQLARELRQVAWGASDTVLGVVGDTGIRLWQPGRPDEVVRLTEHPAPVHALAFSPDGKWMATGGEDRNPILWSLPDLTQRHLLRTDAGETRSLTFSADGSRLASGHLDGGIRLWAVPPRSNEVTEVRVPGSAMGVQLTPGADRVGGITGAGDLEVYSLLAMAPETPVRLPSRRGRWAMGPGAVQIALAGDDGSIGLGRSRAGQWVEESRFAGVGEPVWDLVFSADGTRLAMATRDSWIVLLAVPGCSEVRRWRLPAPARGGLAMSRKGEWMAYALRDGKTWLGRTRGADEARVLPASQVEAFAFSPDDRFLATVHAAGTINLWEVTTGRLHRAADRKFLRLGAVTFTPDGRRLVAGAVDGTVRVLDARDLLEVASFHGEKGRASLLMFQDDARTMISVGEHGRTQVWRTSQP